MHELLDHANAGPCPARATLKPATFAFAPSKESQRRCAITMEAYSKEAACFDVIVDQGCSCHQLRSNCQAPVGPTGKDTLDLWTETQAWLAQ